MSTEAGKRLLAIYRRNLQDNDLDGVDDGALASAIAAIEAEARAAEREVVAEGFALMARALAALGGFIWLGNNLHNTLRDPLRFREFYEAAMDDARFVYEGLRAIVNERGER